MKTEYTLKRGSAFYQRILLFVTLLFAFVSLIGCKKLEHDSEQKISYISTLSASTYHDLSSPIVLVMANDPDKRKEGCGAVIGDGSLVVTAYHIVMNYSDIGLHSMPLFPVVISPYLGDICYGRILAADHGLDLAILEIPWFGHPSYTLATNQELHEIDQVALISYIGEVVNGKHHILGDFQTERLSIRDLSSRRGIVSEVFLKGYGQLSEGWSGCPIVFEKQHLLVGCFTTIHSVKLKVNLSIWPDESGYNSTLQEFARGSAVGWMRKLIIEANASEKLNKAGMGLQSPSDSNDAIKHLLKAIEHEALNEDSMKKGAVTESKLFLDLRPKSVIGIIKYAGNLTSIGQLDLAEKYYKHAIEYNNSRVYALMAYGQFLEENKRPNEAVAQYHKAEILELNNPHVAYAIARVITNSDIEENPLSQIEQLIQKYPENGHLLALRAQIHLRQGQIDQAIETTKAVIKLMPENVRYRRILSAILEQNHRVDEAEIQLRDILKLTPDEPSALFRVPSMFVGLEVKVLYTT
jgi:tetratricopeptide (TPR) repeat protein